ncbi:hypothetical protein D910_11196 [Dendroctonus ponderosae]|uniref:Anaphase-promoting complex subunit 4 n=1 Tax=Dendroctonus ponderosae TaxID=77166 RepID=U4UUS6_DENPD|nr:hypothetical protein D910_11196 [Dendroctonus ponderosae]
MTETWESILLDIDTKLSNYARKRPAEGVTVDFLELLVWGECAPTLQEFLLVDLTKKGLETFGHAVDMSYSTIRTVLIDHVLTFSQNGVYHLSEMKGMAAFKDRYGSGISSKAQLNIGLGYPGLYSVETSKQVTTSIFLMPMVNEIQGVKI